MKILLVSPYHGGSHKAWAEGYRANSRHDVITLTMPARFWKWRMHGGAVTLSQQFWDDASYTPDLILATDLLDLTTFLALTRRITSHIPVALYMHENQLTYPLPKDPSIGPMRRQLGERDRHYAFINYISMMAADRVFFNSQYHRNAFFTALPPFLSHFPEYKGLETIESLISKSVVLPVGIDLQRFDHGPLKDDPSPIPSVIWNQRLEYDKNPEGFISVLVELANEGFPFRVAICGERFGQPTEKWTAGIASLGDRVIFNGFADDPTYHRLLREADITVSTAHHEFFGIGILEAIYCHTFPLLPARLSYPELIPAEFHPYCLYRGRADLVKRLRQALTNVEGKRSITRQLASSVAGYDWSIQAPLYDQVFESLVQGESQER